MSQQTLFRVMFAYSDSVYEIYAQSVSESNMFGFLEVEEFVFGENSTLVVDPSEERLKLEFENVKRTYIPMHAVLRIDEVSKRGASKIREQQSSSNNKVSIFPNPGKPKE